MKRSQVFPSTYLSKEDVAQIPHGTVLSIQDVRLETIKGDGAEEEKAVCHFTGTKPDGNPATKPMILNNTNWLTLEEAYGEDSDAWRGKQVEVYVDPGVMYAGKRVGGVRVRIPRSAAQAWTIEQACAQAMMVGITRDEIVAALKAEGKSGWNSVRDTPTVQKMIANKTPAETVPPSADDIPF